MKKAVKVVLGLLIIGGIIAGVVIDSIKRLEVDGMIIKEEELEETFKERGVVISLDAINIYSNISGKVLDILVVEGEMVKKGQELIKFDTTDLDAQIHQLEGQLKSLDGQEASDLNESKKTQIYQAQAAIKSLEVQVAIAKSDYDKANVDYSNLKITVRELEQYKVAYEQVKSLLKQQEETLNLLKKQTKAKSGIAEYYQGQRQVINAQIEQLKGKKNNGTIEASIDAIVEKIHIKKGSFVNSQTQVLSLLGQNNRVVEVTLLPEDVSRISIGTQVEFIQERRGGDLKAVGSVRTIAEYAEEKMSSLGLLERRVRVTVSIDDNKSDFKFGYPVDIYFKVGSVKNAILIPKMALFADKKDDVVWIANNNIVEIRVVKKGISVDDRIIIKDGLEPGDIVITNPEIKGLKIGALVDVSNEIH